MSFNYRARWTAHNAGESAPRCLRPPQLKQATGGFKEGRELGTGQVAQSLSAFPPALRSGRFEVALASLDDGLGRTRWCLLFTVQRMASRPGLTRKSCAGLRGGIRKAHSLCKSRGNNLSRARLRVKDIAAYHDTSKTHSMQSCQGPARCCALELQVIAIGVKAESALRPTKPAACDLEDDGVSVVVAISPRSSIWNTTSLSVPQATTVSLPRSPQLSSLLVKFGSQVVRCGPIHGSGRVVAQSSPLGFGPPL